jgi:anaerobic magnesium-protoporphyrin IX monomethyl ester cyclase
MQETVLRSGQENGGEMKVLLVVKSMVIESLGVMYLSAVVKQAGHEAKICEMDDAISCAKLWRPDIIGFSVMTGDQEKVKWISEAIIGWWAVGNKQPEIVVGGPHPTFFPEDFLPDSFVINGVNYVVAIGEGENTMVQMLGGAPDSYPTIDSIPWADRFDYPNHKIRDFITTRGCPYNCSYCYNEAWAKMFPEVDRVRTRDVDDVVAEIEDVAPEFVYFQDSCFGLNKNWFREFSMKYSARVNIPYHCHMRPNQVTDEQVLLLHDSGCMSVRIALESASSRLRDLMNRTNTDLDKVLRAVKLLRKWDIKLMIQNIIGMPTGTIMEDLETLEFNIRCKPAYGWVSIFSPYPGTELGDRCKREGWYTGDYSDITDCFFDTSFLNITPEYREQLECLQKIFALCVEVGYLPDVEELTHANFPKLVHKVMRKQGDRRLYGGVV